MDEYWDIYDKNRVFQNRTILRRAPFKKGEYYVCCEVWLKNSQGQLLITQRSPSKKAGGLWEFIGGGVLSGETTAQAVVREVKEEIGLDIAESELSYLTEYKRKNYFMDIYLINKDVDVCDLVLNLDETQNAKWITEKELEVLITDNVFVRSVAQRYIMLKDQI